MRFLVEMFGYSHSCWVGLRPPQGTTSGRWIRINTLPADFTFQSFSSIIPAEWRKRGVFLQKQQPTSIVRRGQVFICRESNLLKDPDLFLSVMLPPLFESVGKSFVMGAFPYGDVPAEISLPVG